MSGRVFTFSRTKPSDDRGLEIAEGRFRHECGAKKSGKENLQ